MTTGQKIKKIRLSLGLTLEEFGKKIDDASKSNVLQWEKDKNLPNKKRILMISKLSKMSVDNLLNDNEKYYRITKAELNFVLKSLATILRQGMLTDEEFDMYLDIENRFKNEVQQDEN